MRLHALLCFYDEPVENLIACIASLTEAGVDHVVAVDGAYALYPHGEAASHPNQHAAIALTCRELGIACTLHVPASKWQGGESEKRGFMFSLAWSMAAEGDWFWVFDADQAVTRVPDTFRASLEATEYQAAEVTAHDLVAEQMQQKDFPPRFAVRNLFRAQPITVGPAHYTYVGEHGHLWHGNGDENPPCPALDLTQAVEFEHRPDRRANERLLSKLRYYAEREASGIERGDCHDCGQRATQMVAHRWRKSRIGPVAQWMEVCDGCEPERTRVGRIQLRQLGVDPDKASIENRNGYAPAGMTG